MEVKTSATWKEKERGRGEGEGEGSSPSSVHFMTSPRPPREVEMTVWLQGGGGAMGGGNSRYGGGMGGGADTVGNTQGMQGTCLRDNTMQGMGIFFQMGDTFLTSDTSSKTATSSAISCFVLASDLSPMSS